MDAESDSDQSILSTSPHHSPRSAKLKRLKKLNAVESQDPLFSEGDKMAIEPEELNKKRVLKHEELHRLDPLLSEGAKRVLEEHEKSDGLDPLLSEDVKRVLKEPEKSDGLDPLFSEGVKRVLEFTGPEFDDTEWDKDLETLDLPKKVEWKNKNKRNNIGLKRAPKDQQPFGSDECVDSEWDKEMETLDLPDKVDFAKAKKTKKRKNVGNNGVDKPKVSKKKENEERKAYLAQQADFQRIMRERKSVGFKPVPMVEKPISSVLEKIRQRKMEVSKKSVHTTTKESMLYNHVEDEEFVIKDVLGPTEFDAPVDEASEDKSCSSDGETRSNDILVEETLKSFRPAVDDTQDLFSDSQASDFQEIPLNEPRSPVEDVSPSLQSLKLRLDSVRPDDMSSCEEESDKENNDPLPEHLRKDKFFGTSDPLRQFLDEEALEDDSDNELLHPEDRDEEDDDDMEELSDFIATDYKENAIDRERRTLLHQTLIQQDELKLKKPEYGASQSDEDESDDNDDVGLNVKKDKPDSKHTGDRLQKSSTNEITTMLIKMIPQMFTDEDDGFVSSEDEETKRSLSRENLHHEKQLERKTKLMSSVKDVSSKEVLGRIRKLNSVPETKKKAKTPSAFDALLSKGSSSKSNKSFFLRRASSHPAPSSLRQGPSTCRSFIFGRDDSRGLAPVIEDSRALNQTESQVKKVVSSAKFSGSQVNWCTQATQQVSGSSLFDILKRSSIQTGQVTGDNMVDHQAVFASFRSVKKPFKVDR